MAYITQTHSTVLSTSWEKIRAFFAMVGHAMVMSSSMNARLKRVEELKAKTDEELAGMNLRREDIPAYVFRDMIHL